MYYQDHFTKLHECRWSTADKRWIDTQIDTGSPWPMPGTSLAVVAWEKSIRLYYMNVDWKICEAVFDEGVHDTWQVGALNKSKLGAHPESSLSAVVVNTGKGDQTVREIQYVLCPLNSRLISYILNASFCQKIANRESESPASSSRTAI